MLYFTGRDDGHSIEEYIQYDKSVWKENWKSHLHWGFKDEVLIWWQSFDYSEWMPYSEEASEKSILDKWSHAKIKDK
jgi:hypothetical protein